MFVCFKYLGFYKNNQTNSACFCSRGLGPGSASSRYPGRVGGLYMPPDQRKGAYSFML